MKTLNWLADHFSHRGKAMMLYKRGMAKAKKHDHQGAIEDYTTSIALPDAPADVKAMALYNRALVHAARGECPKAADDLNMVLAMTEELPNVKAEARRKLAKIESRSRKPNVL